MVVEKLIKRKGTKIVPKFEWRNNIQIFIHTGVDVEFEYTHEYWYDGVLFLFGQPKGEKEKVLIEASTGARAHAESKASNVNQAIMLFKNSLARSQKDIRGVIYEYNSKILGNNLWLKSLLII